MQFHIWDFYCNLLTQSNFGLNQENITFIAYEIPRYMNVIDLIVVR